MIEDRLSDDILSGAINEGDMIRVDYVDEKVTVTVVTTPEPVEEAEAEAEAVEVAG